MTDSNSKLKHIGQGTFVASANFPIAAVLDKLGVKYKVVTAEELSRAWEARGPTEIIEVKPIEIPDFSPLLNYSYGVKR